MKKITVLILLLIMAVSVIPLTGCAGDVPEDFIVGVIHIGNPSDGAGYSFAHDQGIVAMQEELGLSDNQIIRKVNIADNDAAATKTAMEECIEAGADIIFGTSWGYMETMAELAETYPDIIFSHGSGYMSNDTNFNNYFGRIYQARYLSGLAAALKSQTGKIGYVAAMDVTNSEVTGGLNAFAKGVAAVNPDAEIYVKVTNTWFSVDLENQAAEALLDLGCDVIAQHCDTTAPQLAAEKRGVWGCGYNSNMTKDAPKAHLTAPIWNWGVYYTEAVLAASEGRWAQFGNWFGGFAEDFVDISPLSENCAEGTQEICDKVKALIKDGSFEVFDGKQAVVQGTDVSLVDEALLDNKGNVIVEAGGACLEDGVITGGLNWYYANVIEA
jgi:basic membrane protein A